MKGKMILILAIILAILTLIPYIPVSLMPYTPLYDLEGSKHSEYDKTPDEKENPGNDRDGDGLYDYYEDEDKNGHMTGEEIAPTDPDVYDTDYDSINDGDEFMYWNNRYTTQNYVMPWLRYIHTNLTTDHQFYELLYPDGDLDADGLPNILDQDSDGDLVPDGIEIMRGTDPANPYSVFNNIPDSYFNDTNIIDTDHDGMDDRWEKYYNVTDPNDDPDHDGRTNLEEFQQGTDPLHPDGEDQDISSTSSSIQGFYKDDLDEIVFTVSPSIKPRYWRLTAYDSFDRWSWSQYYITNATYPTTIELPDVTAAISSDIQIYGVSFTGSSRGYLPTALYTTALLNISMNTYMYPPSYQPHLKVDSADGFWSKEYLFGYEFSSVVYSFEADALSGANSSSARDVNSPLYFYTEAPLPFNNRVSNRAQTILSGLSPSASDFEKVVAFQEYLKTYYTYDINASYAPFDKSDDLIDQFLFSTKSGVCTHFASSLVVLCRYSGIPARYVTGFALGELENGQRVVREGHRHAWAEVYFDEFGWVPFEATPPNNGIGGGTGVGSDGADDTVNNGNGTGDGGGTLIGKNITGGDDTDGDGIPDDLDPDDDNDGLPDTEELQAGTDPKKKDTDSDGLSDFQEVHVYFTDPLDYDTDNDGLSDGAEVNEHNTNPNKPDTDEGGIWDGAEVFNGHDPLDPSDDAGITDSDNDGLDDETEGKKGTDPFKPDTDGDGLTDGVEVLVQYTDPLKPDTDDDNITDGEEVLVGDDGYITDPLSNDTDADGLTDWMEIHQYKTNPNFPDSDADGLLDRVEVDASDGHTTDPVNPDTDGDGLKDGEEDKDHNGTVDSVDPADWNGGLGPGETDPNKKDTDGGGSMDSTEVWNGYNPLDPSDDSAVSDTDFDGLTDVMESSIGTDPKHPDSDRDGLTDGEEVNSYYTNPLKPDTDGDGIKDSEEVHTGEDGYITDPLRNDTDKDGLGDWPEIHTYMTDPNDPDSDNDGLWDGTEVNRYYANSTLDWNNDGTVDHHTDPLDQDTDGGGLKDGYEVNLGKNPLDPADDVPPKDSDADGLSDDEEDIRKTNKTDPDTDGDGLKDGDEVYVHGTDPLKTDTDGDLLDDEEEVTTGSDNYITNATNKDTDGDGLDDYQESIYKTNPLRSDTDNDGLTDAQEVNTDLDPTTPGKQTTDPLKADTDNDGLKDGYELNTDFNSTQPGKQSLDPLDPDTDGGGANDGWEIYKGTDPLNPSDDNSIVDTDGDKLTDYEENNIYHTNATNPDTDGDDLDDGAEVMTYHTNASDPDSDNDNLTDGFEIKTGGVYDKYVTDPNSNDTDSDYLTDWEEIYIYGSDPTNNDTDGDGLKDNIEVGRPGGRGPSRAKTFSDPSNPDSDGDGMPDGWMDGWDFATRKVISANKNGAKDLGEFEDRNLNGKVEGGGWNNGTGPGETNPAKNDTDGGGAPDGWEAVNGFDPLNATDDWKIKDTDGDGLCDFYENNTSMTDWTDPDSDGDGLWDGYDIYVGGLLMMGELTGHINYAPTDPLDDDSDDDGAGDGAEVRGVSGYKTDPNKRDTDGDGLWDGYDIGANLGEMDHHHSKQGKNTDPLQPDTDGDGLWDGWNITVSGTPHMGELSMNTNPVSEDTDEDDLTDYIEVTVDRWPGTEMPGLQATDPNDPDTDDGGVLDGIEVIRGTNPLYKWDDNDFGDTDNDGLPNFKENHTAYEGSQTDWDRDGLMENFTQWNNSDTDGDGLSDGKELDIGTHPLINDTDGDGLTDWEEEAVHKTNATNPDTDGDGLEDGYEVFTYYSFSNVDWNHDGAVEHNTDPKNTDSDGGGTPDGEEVSGGTNPLDKYDDPDRPLYDTFSLTLIGVPATMEKGFVAGQDNFTVQGEVKSSDGDMLDSVSVSIYIMPYSVYTANKAVLDEYDLYSGAQLQFLGDYLAASAFTDMGAYSANAFCPKSAPTGDGNVALAMGAGFTIGRVHYNTTFCDPVTGFKVYSHTKFSGLSVFDNKSYYKNEQLDLEGALKDMGDLAVSGAPVEVYYDAFHMDSINTGADGGFSTYFNVGAATGMHKVRISYTPAGMNSYLYATEMSFNIQVRAAVINITASVNKDELIVGERLYVNGTVIAEGNAPLESGTVSIALRPMGGAVVNTSKAEVVNGKYSCAVILAEATYGAGQYNIVVSVVTGTGGESAKNNLNNIWIIGKTHLDRVGLFSSYSADLWVEPGSSEWFDGYLQDNLGHGLDGRRVDISFSKVEGGTYRPDTTVTTGSDGSFSVHFDTASNEPLGKVTVTATYAYNEPLEGLPKYVGCTATAVIKVQEGIELEMLDVPDSIEHGKDFKLTGKATLERTGAPAKTGNEIRIMIGTTTLGTVAAGDDGVFEFSGILSKFTPKGDQVMSVQFTGSDNYRPASTTFSVSVYARSILVIKPEANIMAGRLFNCTVTLEEDSGVPISNEEVEITYDGEGLGTYTTDSSGEILLPLEFPERRLFVELKASYSGNDGIYVLGTDAERDMFATAREPDPQTPSYLLYAGVVMILIAIGAIVYYFLRWRKAHVSSLDEVIAQTLYRLEAKDRYRKTIFECYKDMCEVLTRYGFMRRDCWTPWEFESAIREAVPKAPKEAVGSLTDLFVEARYSDHKFKDDSRRKAMGSLRRIQAGLGAEDAAEDG